MTITGIKLMRARKTQFDIEISLKHEMNFYSLTKKPEMQFKIHRSTFDIEFVCLTFDSLFL